MTRPATLVRGAADVRGMKNRQVGSETNESRGVMTTWSMQNQTWGAGSGICIPRAEGSRAWAKVERSVPDHRWKSEQRRGKKGKT